MNVIEEQTVSTRAEALATQFEEANDAVIAAVERCDAATWQRHTDAEQWPVAFAAWHIGGSLDGVWELISAVANGEPAPPITAAMLDAKNAGDVAAHGDASREEVLDLLRERGAAVATAIRGLTDAQLDRAAALELLGGQEMTVEQLIGVGLIGHAQQHLGSIHAVA